MLTDPKRRKLTQAAPINYVAGLGRGATGFTTRSDIGDAREPFFGAAPEGYVAGRGRGATAFSRDEDEAAGAEEQGSSAALDGERLFADTEYDDEDKEADQLWDAIEERMDQRRKAKREAREKEELEKFRASRPKTSALFADLRPNLTNVAAVDWEKLSEIGDRSLRYKPRREERLTPAPDSLLEKARQESQFAGAITPDASGLTSVGGITDLKALGEAKSTVLRSKLAAASDSVTGQTNIDKAGYLTDLDSVKINTEAEIGDIKKARLLLKSVTESNPKHAPGWIAFARLEEAAGRITAARKIINEGCEHCPTNQDIWSEAARLNLPEQSKAILARAVAWIPESVLLWIEAANLEQEVTKKKRVLRKALENNSTSVKLWREAIQLEDPDDARILLTRAVECVPHSTQMWLALAKLETYENAKKVLNRARQKIPTEKQIWIAAAQLEEAHGSKDNVGIVIKKAIKSLVQHGVAIDKEEWLKEAERCEKAGSIVTCHAIVVETVGVGVDDQDRKKTWKDDAEGCIARASPETARAIYEHATSILPSKKGLWLAYARMEKQHGTFEKLEGVLSRATKLCPTAEVLWLMFAKEKWISGDLKGARDIIKDAYAANPNSEQIWLAAVKLEKENEEFDRARALLERARASAGTARVWMKSALLERELGNYSEERSLLVAASEKFPTYPKLWMMLGQNYELAGENIDARKAYSEGLRSNPTCVPLWICSIRFEEKLGGAAKARSVLEQARLKAPKSDLLWLEAVRIEQRADNHKMAQLNMSKALQECPNSGILWAQCIEMEAKPTRQSKAVEAMRRCDNNPLVFLSVARLFWADRKIEKARKYFESAIATDPNLGDAWAAYYRFEAEHGTHVELIQRVLDKCVAADPHHGEKWIQVSKASSNYKLRPDEILKKVAALMTALL